MNLPFKYYHRWQIPSVRRNGLNNGYLFMVPRLHANKLTSPLRTYNNLRSYNHSYLKSSLIKVIYVLLLNPIFSNCILYKLKPVSNYNRIFALSSLIIVFAAEFTLEFCTIFDEVCSLVLTN